MTLPILPLLVAYFVFDEPLGRWRSTSTGRFVSQATVMGEVNKVLDVSAQTMNGYADQLRAGEIGLDEFRILMEQQIRINQTASAAAARGGWDRMSKSDWGWVGSQVKRQYQYLDGFIRDLATGKMKLNGRVNVRAKLYAEAGRGTYEEMRRRMMKVRGKTLERRILGQAEHCNGCIAEAARGWQPIGTLSPYRFAGMHDSLLLSLHLQVSMTDKEFWILVRQALLLFVDAIERRYGLRRTAELRKAERIACIDGTIVLE